MACETDKLNDLRLKRENWVKASRDNKFDEGIKRLLTELYPDNAHFIFELLQNAEDTKATEVKFTLEADRVEFEHNGSRLFSLADVESITNIGESTKRDDHTSIGKFGVGFKAVFAYTNTPEIRSGDFHFRIHDLVVPEAIADNSHRVKTDHLTRFSFPLDHHKKKQKQASAEVEMGLLSLGDNTLLFLSHIRRIDYCLPDKSTGWLERIEHENGYIEIRSCHPDSDALTSHWLRFEKDVEVTDDNGDTKSCRIAIAYSMVEAEDKRKKTSDWKIIPLDHGQVSIFFPAEKETSNLRFHLHAPFASTVARDSVRECKANDLLRDHLSELVVESLTTIRDMGMLTVTFLAALPNPNDNLPDFYEHIRDAIVEAFQEQELTPTRSGGHATTSALFTGPSKIADVLGDEGLVVITGYDPPLWSANPPPQNQRAEHFLESLEIDEWGWHELVESLRSTGFSGERDQDKQDRVETWIKQMKDEKLMRLYALLGEAYSSRSSDCYPLSTLHIIRVATENADVHLMAQQVFLQPSDDVNPPHGIFYVKPEVYSKGRSDEQKVYAQKFLEHIGIRPFDEKEAIVRKIASYVSPTARIPKNYMQDMKDFVEFCLQNPAEYKRFIELPLLRGTSTDGVTQWGKPYEFYIDQPYMDTGLDSFFNDESIKLEKKKKRLLDDYYKIPRFTEFAVKIGVMAGLEIREYKATEMQQDRFPKNGRNTETTIDNDYFINGLNSVWHWHSKSSKYFLGEIPLKNKIHSVSNTVWKTLCRAEPRDLEARYLPNASKRHEEQRDLSILVRQLKASPWVPDNSGNFKKPSDICREELHHDFQWDDRNGWLTAIGFGENVRKRSEEYRVKNQAAQDIGFESVDEAKVWAELAKSGANPKELLSKFKTPELPEGSVNNPDRRRKRMLDDSANAPDKESVRRERSIQPGISEDTGKAKAYLRSIYINHDDELVCQCCRQTMPFKIEELHYFEAVQCIKDLKKRCIENRLALCPTCSAMYQFVRKTDDSEMRRRIVQLKAPDTSPTVEIPVTLAGLEFRLHFVGKHWFDLKTILETE